MLIATNRITPGGAARRALLAAAVLLALATGLAACGGGGELTTGAPDKEGDAEALNRLLTRKTAAVGAYEQVVPQLTGRARAAAAEFRAQEQEQIDALVKTLRGLGAKAEPEREVIEPSRLKSRVDRLRFLYEVESATIDSEQATIAELTSSWPRALVSSMQANQAQRLVLIRAGLGAEPSATVPDAFEDGTTPAP